MRTLNGITAQRGLARTIKTNNSSEFISKMMDKWDYERVELDFRRGQASPPTTPPWRALMAGCARST